MKILGNRVYLILPPLPDSQVKLLPEAQKRMEEEMRTKFDKLTVYATGEGGPGVTVSVKAGDVVFVDPSAARRATVLKIDDIEVICVNSYDIMHIW